MPATAQPAASASLSVRSADEAAATAQRFHEIAFNYRHDLPAADVDAASSAAYSAQNAPAAAQDHASAGDARDAQAVARDAWRLAVAAGRVATRAHLSAADRQEVDDRLGHAIAQTAPARPAFASCPVDVPTLRQAVEIPAASLRPLWFHHFDHMPNCPAGWAVPVVFYLPTCGGPVGMIYAGEELPAEFADAFISPQAVAGGCGDIGALALHDLRAQARAWTRGQ